MPKDSATHHPSVGEADQRRVAFTPPPAQPREPEVGGVNASEAMEAEQPMEVVDPERTIDARHCTFVKDDGSRCKGWKVKGTDLCAGHGAGFGHGGADPREAASRSAEVRRGNAEVRKRRPQEVYNEAMVENAAEFVAARLALIRDPRALPSDRLRAMEQLEARAMGKPKEHVLVEAEEPESLAAIRAMSRDERRDLMRRLEGSGRLSLVPPADAASDTR
jgi:hypothetical protein